MANLNLLPLHLKVRILRELGPPDEIFKTAAVMRLVSKDWLLAFGECPGNLVWVKKMDAASLRKLSALAPFMEIISFGTFIQSILLQPLAACTRLKSVSIEGIVPGNAPGGLKTIKIDLNGPPPSMLRMKLKFDPQMVIRFEIFHCHTLKQLLIHWSRHVHEEECYRLLQCLPGLEVRIRALC